MLFQNHFRFIWSQKITNNFDAVSSLFVGLFGKESHYLWGRGSIFLLFLFLDREKQYFCKKLKTLKNENIG